MNSVRCPSKMQNGRFPLKSALLLKKVCYKVSLSEYCQQQSCKAYLPVQKWLVGTTSSSTWKLRRSWPTPFKNANFQSIFAYSASAVTVTPSEKVQLMQIESPLRAFQWA